MVMMERLWIYFATHPLKYTRSHKAVVIHKKRFENSTHRERDGLICVFARERGEEEGRASAAARDGARRSRDHFSVARPRPRHSFSLSTRKHHTHSHTQNNPNVFFSLHRRRRRRRHPSSTATAATANPPPRRRRRSSSSSSSDPQRPRPTILFRHHHHSRRPSPARLPRVFLKGTAPRVRPTLRSRRRRCHRQRPHGRRSC